MSNKFNLSDTSIAQIAKLLQLALLSGTDIIDHLRMMVLEDDGEGNLVPTGEYLEVFENTMRRMTEELDKTSCGCDVTCDCSKNSCEN